ncbi:MAG TPA: hypothetical protein VFU06_03430 [Longimicrobiales bacterium]|nr:hypothetical protein [Longimicrobiales bacterium]
MDRSSTGETGNDERFAASANRSSMESRADSTKAVEQVRDTVKEELRSAGADVQRRAADNVNRQKHRVADRLDSIVHALNAARNSLQDDDQGQLASYVGDLTSQVERSTGYLRNNDYGAMMRDMENLARNNTGVFLGSTFVAGLAMGRFLRASEPDDGELQGDEWRRQAAGGRSFAGEPGGSYGGGGMSDEAYRRNTEATSYRSQATSRSPSRPVTSDFSASRPGGASLGGADTTYGASGFQANTFSTSADRGMQRDPGVDRETGTQSDRGTGQDPDSQRGNR